MFDVCSCLVSIFFLLSNTIPPAVTKEGPRAAVSPVCCIAWRPCCLYCPGAPPLLVWGWRGILDCAGATNYARRLKAALEKALCSETQVKMVCLKEPTCSPALKPSPGVGRDLPPWQWPTATTATRSQGLLARSKSWLSGDLIACEPALTTFSANRINSFIAFQIRLGDSWSLKDSEGKDPVLER